VYSITRRDKELRATVAKTIQKLESNIYNVAEGEYTTNTYLI